MTTQQPRQPVGARTSGVSTGGRFAQKPVPTIETSDLDFNTRDVIGPPCDWHTRTVHVNDTDIVFERHPETSGTAVSVTTNCDPPDMLLLHRKNDVDYWSYEKWCAYRDETLLWTVEIARQMLEEGFVATGYDDNDAGIRTVMTTAGGGFFSSLSSSRNALSRVVAHIRGLRLLQSMAGHSPEWRTGFGGRSVPDDVWGSLAERYETVCGVYHWSRRPPWSSRPQWGPQTVAGHATTVDGNDMFVGEHSDLLWRALTETDCTGLSPLKVGLVKQNNGLMRREMVTAAALHDETAQQQLTHGLFDGVEPGKRAALQTHVLRTLTEALDPPDGLCRWFVTQQEQLRGFVDVVEALEP